MTQLPTTRLSLGDRVQVKAGVPCAGLLPGPTTVIGLRYNSDGTINITLARGDSGGSIDGFRPDDLEILPKTSLPYVLARVLMCLLLSAASGVVMGGSIGLLARSLS